jgi:hypothetical protein
VSIIWTVKIAMTADIGISHKEIYEATGSFAMR